MNEKYLLDKLYDLHQLYVLDSEDYYSFHVEYHSLCEEDLGNKDTIKLFRSINKRDWESAKKFLEQGENP